MLIYGLCDPDSGELRYVGRTGKSLAWRLMRHCCVDKRKSNHRTRWVTSLVEQGRQPDIFLIEDVPDADGAERECFYIAYFKSLGCRLVNAVISGDGGRTDVSDETRAKLRAAGRRSAGKHKPWSEERLKAFREKTLGVKRGPQSAEHKRKRLQHLEGNKFWEGKKHSEETKQKIAEATRGRVMSDETRAKLRAAAQLQWQRQQAAGYKPPPKSEKTRMKISRTKKAKARELRDLRNK